MTNPQGRAVQADYDLAGHNTAVKDLNASVVEPSTTAHPAAADRTWTTGYDAEGNPVSQDQPGDVKITTAYDALGRVSGQTGTGAEVATAATAYGYDLAGRTTSINSPTGTIAINYDDRGDPLTTTSASTTSSAAYDANGRLTKRVDQAGTATFNWNGNDQLVSGVDPVTGLAYTRTYDTGKRLTGVTYGTSGAKRTLAYDEIDRITSDQTLSNSNAVLASAAYVYNADNQVTQTTSTGGPQAGVHTYSYDRSGRLTGWTKPDGTVVSYGWDDAGNRTSAGSATYTYDERNRLTSGGGSTYTYTARGTLATTVTGSSINPTQSDALGRVITDGSVSYAYDGLGRLAQRTAGRVTTSLAYSSDGNDPVAVLAADGSPTARFGRDPAGGLLSTSDGGVSSWAVTNRHGDVIAGLNPSGTALTGTTTAYTPFGEIAARTGTASTLGYQGEWTDPDSGKVNMQSRWYTPSSGGFSSRDTLTQSPDHSVQGNRYAYGNDDPLNKVDPTGHYADWGGPFGEIVLGTAEATGEVAAEVTGVVLGVAFGWEIIAAIAVGAALGAGLAWVIGNAVGPLYSPSTRDPGTHERDPCANFTCWGQPAPGDPSGNGQSDSQGDSQGYSQNDSQGGGGTASGYNPPEPPNVGDLVLRVARTPAPRPAYRPVIDQKTLDHLVRVIEAKDKHVVARMAKILADTLSTDKPTAEPQPGNESGTPRTPRPPSQNDDEANCLSGKSTLGKPHYWDLDGSGRNGIDRATGADACYSGTVPTDGTRARVDPPGFAPNTFGNDLNRGHLIAKSLGGNGSDYRNLAPIWGTANRKMYHEYEILVKPHVKYETVFYQVIPQYRNGRNMPYEIDIRIVGSLSGEIADKPLDNIDDGTGRRDIR